MPNVGGREGIHYPLYDKVVLEAAQANATLFQVPVGQAGKTLYDTNMRLAGQLQTPETFDVFAICAGGLPDDDWTSVATNMKGTLELSCGNKVYYEIPLFWLSAGGGLNVQQAIMGTTSAVIYTSWGVPHSRNMHTLRNPIRITSGEAFRVELVWPTAPGVGKIVWVRLEGVLRRSIQ